MADAEVRNVRAVAGPNLIQAYGEALVGMARRETGDPSMTMNGAERWYNEQRAAAGVGPSRLASLTAPSTS
jgi:hypothetical protein